VPFDLCLFTDSGRVAQVVEHRTFNPVAAGSSPAPFTNDIKGLRVLVSPFFLAAVQRTAVYALQQVAAYCKRIGKGRLSQTLQILFPEYLVQIKL
jgi:hypothetical protein